ncbi:MAG: hypothetical protein AB7I19_20315 [Planctomycetota bacterium]
MLDDGATSPTVTLSRTGTFSLPVAVPGQSMFGDSDRHFHRAVLDLPVLSRLSSYGALHDQVD